MNGDPSEICCSCDAPLGRPGHSPVSRRVATVTEGNLAVQPEWRREVSSRLQDYRARRGGAAARLQAALPFDSDPMPSLESFADMPAYVAPPVPESSGLQAHRYERFEIAIPNWQPVPSADPNSLPDAAAQGAGVSPARLSSVASLQVRRRAAILDVGLLLFSYGGMLALFTVLGGRIGLNKLDLAVAGATLALFYAQYFALFTIFGGSTPGMMLRGLRVVSFDGSTPSSRQMAWRSFGYLISAGTCFLGFLWALCDEDHLCWQDRMSQTYLTPNEEGRR